MHQPTRRLILNRPHPWAWLARPDRWAFAVEVVHGDQHPAWTRWAVGQYADRWSHDELVRAVRFAARLAPLPVWAAALLRRSVVAA